MSIFNRRVPDGKYSILAVGFPTCRQANNRSNQWRRQLVGTCPPWRSIEIFFARLYVETIVWFGLVLCQTLNSALFVQPYSLWNDTITGYNGACAKVNVVFTARRYALAQSLLSASVCPSRSYIVSRWLKISSNFFFDQVATSFQFFFTPSTIPNSKETP